MPRHGSARTTTRRGSSTASRVRSTNGRSGMGFEYFYGFLGGETDQWTPYLFRNTTQVFPWVGKPGYNLTTDMADEAIRLSCKQINAAAPDKPFFLYYVPGGSHAPHQPTKEWIEKFKGKFDMGWNAMREQIFANQKRLGVIPANTELTPWPDDLPKWESLSLVEKKLFARQAEVFAAYTAYTDHEIGRVIQAVEDSGKLDNTLIIYICGDNGTSAGRHAGRHAQPDDLLQRHTGRSGRWSRCEFYEAWGSPATYPHMAVAWSWAFDTPFKWTKQVASHFGGTRQGLAISWPGRIKDAGGNPHAVPPHHRYRADDSRSDGHQPRRSRSMASRRSRSKASAWRTRWRRRTPSAPSARTTQYFEMVGNRAIYHDGWYRQHDAPVRRRGSWTGQDAGRRQRLQVGALQHHRRLLAGQRPRGEDAGQAASEMQALFFAEATKYNVFPLDNSGVRAGDHAAPER